jgi:hypothetical protein
MIELLGVCHFALLGDGGGFRATVGALVPNSVGLAPVPATIADLIPQTKGLESAMLEGQWFWSTPRAKK